MISFPKIPESMTETGMQTKTKGTVCRLESIKDILNIIFRDGGKSHSKFYCVSYFNFTCLHSIFSLFRLGFLFFLFLLKFYLE